MKREKWKSCWCYGVVVSALVPLTGGSALVSGGGSARGEHHGDTRQARCHRGGWLSPRVPLPGAAPSPSSVLAAVSGSSGTPTGSWAPALAGGQRGGVTGAGAR